MKNIVLALAVCAALAGCAGSTKDGATAAKPPVKPADSLLTAEDMHYCEQQLGIMQPKTATDVYGMSADSIEKIKDCAFEREKNRMPLLADLIDKYRFTIQQGNKECAKDIGTHNAGSCLKDSLEGAADWYNLAVSQRLLSALPNQPQVQPSKP